MKNYPAFKELTSHPKDKVGILGGGGGGGAKLEIREPDELPVKT